MVSRRRYEDGYEGMEEDVLMLRIALGTVVPTLEERVRFLEEMYHSCFDDDLGAIDVCRTYLLDSIKDGNDSTIRMMMYFAAKTAREEMERQRAEGEL